MVLAALFTLAGLYVPTNDLSLSLSPPVAAADLERSVVLVSVIWVIVVSRLEQSDLTCNHPHSLTSVFLSHFRPQKIDGHR